MTGGHHGGRNVRNRGLGGRPLPPLKYENLVDEEVNEGADGAEEEPGMIASIFGGLRSAIESAFGWCSDREDEEVMDIERASAESLLRFKAHFVQNYRRVSHD